MANVQSIPDLEVNSCQEFFALLISVLRNWVCHTLIQFSATVSNEMRGERSDSRISLLFHPISSSLAISSK